MGFLYSQVVETRRLPYPDDSYTDQTIVITGSNTGLGKEAARHYARLAAKRLILAVRNLEKGFAAKKDIEATVAGPTAIMVWELDLGSHESIKAFAARVETELNRVDIFHANAGVVSTSYKLTEACETNIAINLISTFLLVALILPKLKAVADEYSIRPTIAITSSGAHKHTKFPQKSEPHILEAVNDRNYANGAHWIEQYPVSKLIGVFVVRAIAKKFPADRYPVTINLVDPGLCHSELSREAAGIQRVAFTVMKTLLARSAEQGSRNLVHGGHRGPESHGQYLADCKIADPSSVVLQNPDVQDKLWRELKERLEEIQPGVTQNF